MNRCSMIAVALLFAGCAPSRQTADPFLGRSTIPPPGTAVVGPNGQPIYYGAPGTMQPPVVSGGVQVQPGTPFTPGAAPGAVMPGAVTPGTGQPINPAPGVQYQPPGGFSPQSAIPMQSAPGQPSATSSGATRWVSVPAAGVPASGQPTLAPLQGEPTLAKGSNPSPRETLKYDPSQGVVRVSYDEVAEAADGDLPTTGGRVQPASWNAAIPAADRTAIRIVEAPQPATVAKEVPTWNGAPIAADANAWRNSASATVRSDAPANAARSTGLLINAPSTSTVAPAVSRVVTSSASPAAVATTPSSAKGYGYDPGYAWLKGQLEYSQTSKRWKLRYIAVDGATDDYGGSVVLADNAALEAFQSGDWVTVNGQPSAKTETRGFAPFYTVSRIVRQ